MFTPQAALVNAYTTVASRTYPNEIWRFASGMDVAHSAALARFYIFVMQTVEPRGG